MDVIFLLGNASYEHTHSDMKKIQGDMWTKQIDAAVKKSPSEKCTSDLSADSNECKNRSLCFPLYFSVCTWVWHFRYMTLSEMINIAQLGLFTYKREHNKELKNYLSKALKGF